MESDAFRGLYAQTIPSGQARPSCVRLTMPVEMDPRELRADLSEFVSSSWRPQRTYNSGSVTRSRAAGWKVIPLRSIGGHLDRTDPGGPGTEGFRDTEILAAMPAFRRLLQALPGELRSVRLMALEPGTTVPEHRDDFVGFRFGQVRLHVPIQTNSHAIMTIGGVSVHWDHGLWYGDFSQPHSLANAGATPRIHLVMDCLVTAGLLGLFPAEFLGRIPAHEMLVNSKRITMPQLQWRQRDVIMPAELLVDPLADVSQAHEPEELAHFVSMPEAVMLTSGDGAVCCLDPISDSQWRIRGWTDERTFIIDDDVVTLRVRRGTLIQEIRLTLLRATGARRA